MTDPTAVSVDAERLAELGVTLPENESSTLGGFVIAKLGRIARNGDSVQLEGYTAKVIEMKGRRVSKLLMAPTAAAAPAPPEPS